MKYILVESDTGSVVFESDVKDKVLDKWEELDEEESEGDLPRSYHMEESGTHLRLVR